MRRVPGAKWSWTLRDLLTSTENLLTAGIVFGLLAWTDPAAMIPTTRIPIATSTAALPDRRRPAPLRTHQVKVAQRLKGDHPPTSTVLAPVRRRIIPQPLATVDPRN